MRHGVSLREGTGPGEDVLAALDRWAKQAGGYPDMLPIWHRVQVHTLDVPLLRCIKSRGVEPLVYATSTTRSPVVPYESYLAGEQDGKLDELARAADAYGDRLIVRWDHEQSMQWPPWGGRDPALYRNVFDYVADRLRQAGNVRMYWCGWGPTPTASLRYLPDSADFVGFDQYSRTAGWHTLRKEWAPIIGAIRKRTDKPIIVGEFGRLAGLPKRGRWLRSLRNVSDVWAAIYFDMLLISEGVDWRMTRWMRRQFAG